jgi:nickel-dependent lactate racemase
MKVKLAYGKQGLEINLPDDWKATVVEPRYVPGLPNPIEAIRQALREQGFDKHVQAFANNGHFRAGIIFSDITRPTPNHIILPVVLDELARAGVPNDAVTLFNALGTHRPNTDAELRRMLGDTVVENYRIVQNNAFDTATQVCIGNSSRGHEIWLNKELVACDLKILTGFIEPHFFAGFSGGGKAVMPGMAGQRTVLHNHCADMIGNPNATWGITWGNPIWEEAHEAATMVAHNDAQKPSFSEYPSVFLLNVALNKEKQITGVFAGDLDEAHARGCAFVKQTAMQPAPHTYDIVITTNSGYPLDLNLYQTVKGMCAAAQVVRPGGTIIAASECWDGIPDHGLYGKLLRESADPRAMLDRINAPGFLEQDQWEAQIQAQIQLKADVYLYSDGLSDAQITSAMLKPCHDIVKTVAEVRERMDSEVSICVLPEGPQTVPYVA